jgi:hypothetical protein
MMHETRKRKKLRQRLRLRLKLPEQAVAVLREGKSWYVVVNLTLGGKPVTPLRVVIASSV